MYNMFLRLLVAGILAGLIGIERELRSKEAGLRTHFLVGIGSALITIVSKYGFYDILGLDGIGLDPSRIAAQIVSGVGFLGAGTIILQKQAVKGLTTAAGIWATSGIGIAVGAGLYEISIFSTVLVLVGLEILQKSLKTILRGQVDMVIDILKESKGDIIKSIEECKGNVIYYKSRKNRNNGEETYTVELKVRLKKQGKALDIIRKIEDTDGVISVEVENI